MAASSAFSQPVDHEQQQHLVEESEVLLQLGVDIVGVPCSPMRLFSPHAHLWNAGGKDAVFARTERIAAAIVQAPESVRRAWRVSDLTVLSDDELRDQMGLAFSVPASPGTSMEPETDKEGDGGRRWVMPAPTNVVTQFWTRVQEQPHARALSFISPASSSSAVPLEKVFSYRETATWIAQVSEQLAAALPGPSSIVGVCLHEVRLAGRARG
jgi:hypothetical protein